MDHKTVKLKIYIVILKSVFQSSVSCHHFSSICEFVSIAHESLCLLNVGAAAGRGGETTGYIKSSAGT